MCQHSKHHVCSGHVPVLLFAAHCICFRADVLIIPQPARVAALLTHARAGKKKQKKNTHPAELNFTSPGAYTQTRRWRPAPPPLNPNTLQVHLKTHMGSKAFVDALWSLSINNLVHGHVNKCQCDKCGRDVIRSSSHSISRNACKKKKIFKNILIVPESLPMIRNHYVCFFSLT